MRRPMRLSCLYIREEERREGTAHPKVTKSIYKSEGEIFFAC